MFDSTNKNVVCVQYILFQYPMLDEFTDVEKDVTLLTGDVVEVLDTENDTRWLVRAEQQKDKVTSFLEYCY